MSSLTACRAEPEDTYSHRAREFVLDAVVNEAGLRITVTPVSPWSMNLEYPSASKATAGGVDLPGATVEANGGRFVFEHTTLPGTTGSNRDVIECHARFAVCIDDLCKPAEHRFELTPH